jgi:predicted nucleic acid-binding protein
MAFVVDASVVLAWLLPDEGSPQADGWLDLSMVEQAHAPGLLSWEVANAVTTAVRRGRLPESIRRQLLESYFALPIALAPLDPAALARAVDIAARRRVSAYDAAYLELALERRCALATLDPALRRAAQAEGVALLSPA